MLMKNGKMVPKTFAQALENDLAAWKIFMNMSETYQKLFVKQLTRYDGTSLSKRIAEVIEDIHKYGESNK